MIALIAMVTASMRADVEGIRAAGTFVVTGLTLTAVGLVVSAVSEHGKMFVRALIETASLRPPPPTDSGDGEGTDSPRDAPPPSTPPIGALWWQPAPGPLDRPASRDFDDPDDPDDPDTAPRGVPPA